MIEFQPTQQEYNKIISYIINLKGNIKKRVVIGKQKIINNPFNIAEGEIDEILRRGKLQGCNMADNYSLLYLKKLASQKYFLWISTDEKMGVGLNENTGEDTLIFAIINENRVTNISIIVQDVFDSQVINIEKWLETADKSRDECRLEYCVNGEKIVSVDENGRNIKISCQSEQDYKKFIETCTQVKMPFPAVKVGGGEQGLIGEKVQGRVYDFNKAVNEKFRRR